MNCDAPHVLAFPWLFLSIGPSSGGEVYTETALAFNHSGVLVIWHHWASSHALHFKR